MRWNTAGAYDKKPWWYHQVVRGNRRGKGSVNSGTEIHGFNDESDDKARGREWDFDKSSVTSSKTIAVKWWKWSRNE